MPNPTDNEFNALRARARQKRDLAIAEIKREYETQLVQIAALEQDLLGQVSSRYRTISAAIEAVIPRDRPFSTQDIMVGLEALDPGRYWRRRSIDTHLSRLRERGIVRRVKRATVHEPASYVRADIPIQEVPSVDMTLLEVIGKLLVKPMTTTEIAVAVIESGYPTTMKPTFLRNTITRVLGRSGYKCVGGRWLP